MSIGFHERMALHVCTRSARLFPHRDYLPARAVNHNRAKWEAAVSWLGSKWVINRRVGRKWQDRADGNPF